MKTKKAGHFKLLSFLLSLTLLVGFVPTAAFAAAADEAQWSTDGGATTTTGTFAEALEAVQKDNVGGSIKLLGFVTTTGEIVMPAASVALDLNGRIWTSDNTISVVSGSTLSVSDSASGGEILGIGSSRTITVGAGGTFTLKSGTVTCATDRYNAIISSGTTTVAGGTARTTGSGTAVVNNEDGVFTMSGGILESVDRTLSNEGQATISGGTVQSATSSAFSNSSSAAILTISGGTVQGSENSKNNNVGTVIISGGTVSPIEGGTVKNTNGDGLAITALSLKGVIAETAVSELTFDPEYAYGTDGVITDNKGKLFVWLPAGPDKKVKAVADKKTYVGTIANGAATLIDESAPTVASVAVAPATPSVVVGNTQKFTATITGTNSPEQTATWAVADANSAKTTIDADGLLTVASDETATSLTVTATSTVDTAQSGTATVTLTPAPAATYALTVTGGTGGGSFEENAKVAITANAPEAGMKFDKWTSADGVTFADASAATTTITMPAQAATVTANWVSDKPVTPTAPVIIGGKDQVVEQGKAATFKSDAALKDFKMVLVDGKELASNNYSLKEGSTIVTLNAEFVKTLSVGKHTLSIVSTTGSADTGFTVAKATASGNTTPTPTSLDKKLVKTGDNTLNLGLFAGFLVVAAGGALALSLNRRKSAN